jgi:Na+-transporting NADH:ubiquinone oxidoreductase subunit NqrC
VAILIIRKVFIYILEIEGGQTMASAEQIKQDLAADIADVATKIELLFKRVEGNPTASKIVDLIVADVQAGLSSDETKQKVDAFLKQEDASATITAFVDAVLAAAGNA